MSTFVCPHCASSLLDIFGHGAPRREAESASACRSLARCRCISTIRETSDSGRPVVAIDPNGPQARAYAEIAQAVWQGLSGGARRAAPQDRHRVELSAAIGSDKGGLVMGMNVSDRRGCRRSLVERRWSPPANTALPKRSSSMRSASLALGDMNEPIGRIEEVSSLGSVQAVGEGRGERERRPARCRESVSAEARRRRGGKGLRLAPAHENCETSDGREHAPGCAAIVIEELARRAVAPRVANQDAAIRAFVSSQPGSWTQFHRAWASSRHDAHPDAR